MYQFDFWSPELF